MRPRRQGPVHRACLNIPMPMDAVVRRHMISMARECGGASISYSAAFLSLTAAGIRALGLGLDEASQPERGAAAHSDPTSRHT